MAKFSHLDFIADNLYRRHCFKRGCIGPRWPFLREDLQREFRAKARQIFKKWVSEDRAAQARIRSKKP